VLQSGRTVPVDVAVTGDDGSLRLPIDVRRAGWWNGSARIGDPLGSIVVAAHVDSFTQGLGAFAELLAARPGDHLALGASRLSQEYRVVSARLVPKASLAESSSLFSAAGQESLVLITCGGTYDAARGGYQENFVVKARPIS
jgi:LPXTG-site transpeptidase (sortase) family protein